MILLMNLDVSLHKMEEHQELDEKLEPLSVTNKSAGSQLAAMPPTLLFIFTETGLAYGYILTILL